MKLTFIDWLVVAAYFLLNLLIGLYYRKKASASTEDFFVSGRQVSWWLAGTSMVATTFAADTPLWVTGQVVRHGVAANWFWWSFLLSGMMTVFFFARMWRRAEIITDVELVELRYAGKPAAFLRGFRAVYFGVLINCIILGWVNLAMEKILGISLNIPKFWAVVICMLITAAYTSISGLWGVLWTDLVQFILKMGMLILLAFYAVRAVGGMSVLKSKLAAVDAARGAAAGGSGSILSFVPDLHSPWMPIMTFLVYIGVYWWSVWYPGAEPGGGGYVAQRIFCAKDEKNSLLATLWFNIAHYALRPWAWIITALTVVVLYPQLSLPGADAEGGFVRVWVDYLPGAFRGLMLAAFAAAYMSTVATQLNWGSSYLVNDFYRRFLGKARSKNSAPWKIILWLGVILGAAGGACLAYLALVSWLGIGFVVFLTTSFWAWLGVAGFWTFVIVGSVGGAILAHRICSRLLYEARDERHCVWVSKISTMGLMVLAAAVSYVMHTVAGGWEMVVNIGAGTGAVYLLRWYWWRINAWSEISAMATAAVVSVALRIHSPFAVADPNQFAKNLVLTVIITSMVWVATTFLTQPEAESKLLEFYRRVRPGVKGWKHIAALTPEVAPTQDGWYNLLDWGLGCLMVYMTLFAIGKLILGSTGTGFLFLAIAAISGYIIYWDLSRRGWETLSGKE
ncbi:MAG: sodium:solute symporter family protein [Terriglobia bacterium]